MNELTREDMKLNRKKTKLVAEAQSPAMKKRMEGMKIIEDKQTAPILNDEDYYKDLFNSL